MTDLWTKLKNTKKPIVLYGMGNGADKILDRLQSDGVLVSGVFCSSGFKKNREYRGFTVSDYKSLKQELGNMIILVAFGSHLKEVIQKIEQLSEENELYIPDVPVYGDEIFDLEFARKNRKKIETAYSMLSDDYSKKAFENIILFKLTGNFKLLKEIEADKKEGYRLLNLSDNELYLDLGAYNGDTALEFIEATANYHSIIAVEPDSRNFKKLISNTNGYKGINCINAAISDKNGVMEISLQHGRGITGTAKKTEINCTTIDTICENFSPTFIKMDVEGNEMRAIEGGKRTISQLYPRLKLAAYHNSSDIFEIPLKIKEIAPEYRVYLRHLPCFPAWDTDYIFIR